MTTEDGTQDYIQFLRQRGIITHIVSGNSGEMIPTEALIQDCVAHDVACPVPLPDGTVGINVPDGVPAALAALGLSIEAIETTEKVSSDPGEGRESIDQTLDQIEAALTGTDAALDATHKANLAATLAFDDAEESAWDSDADEIGSGDTSNAWDAPAAFVAPVSEPEIEEAHKVESAPQSETAFQDQPEEAAPDPLVSMMDEVLSDDVPDASSEPEIQPRHLLEPEDAEKETEIEIEAFEAPDEMKPEEEGENPDSVQSAVHSDRAAFVPEESIAAAPSGTDQTEAINDKLARVLNTQEEILDRLDLISDMQTSAGISDFDVGTDRLMTAFNTALKRFNEASANETMGNVPFSSTGSDVRILAALQEIMALQMANLLQDQPSDTDPALLEMIMDLRHAVAELAAGQDGLKAPEIPAGYLSGINAA